MTTVTLANGQQADSASYEWRHECLLVHNHVLNLKLIKSRSARAEYLSSVAKEQGLGMADHVGRRFAEEFEQMRAAVRKAAEVAPT